MAKRLHQLRRRAAFAAATMFLGTVGCAFPHGSTAGDPVLGNFHRPIVPTPPPERGGLGLDSPAYDAGARIGVSPPDIPTPVENTSGFMTLPTLTSPNLFSSRGSSMGDSSITRRGAGGARLPSASDSSMRLPSGPGISRMTPDSVMPRPRDPIASFTSGASLNQVEPVSPIRMVSFEAPRDPASLDTVEEAHAHFQGLGATGQRSELLSNGEWFFTCTVGQKVYEARGQDQFDAMRKVAHEVKKNR